MGMLIKTECKYCQRYVMKNSINGKDPDTEPICSRKNCKKQRPKEE